MPKSNTRSGRITIDFKEGMIAMNAGGRGTLRDRVSARSVLLAAAVGGAILALVGWSVRQARLTDEALSRAIAAEKAAARAQVGVDRSQAREDGQLQAKRDLGFVPAAHRPTKSDAERAKQLSDEIAGLSALQDKIENEIHDLQVKAVRNAKNPPPSYPLP
jgi:hypothetical protein